MLSSSDFLFVGPVTVTVSLTPPALTVTSTVRASRLTSVRATSTVRLVGDWVSGIINTLLLLCSKPGVPATKLSG